MESIEDLVITPDKFLDNLKPYSGYYNDKKRGQAVCDWIEKYCILTSSKWRGQPFRLFEWQKKIIRIFYGFVKDVDGKKLRQYQTLFCNVPKKNGKTQLVAALALYHLIADGEETPEIYSIAVDQEQSKIVYNDSIKMVKANPLFRNRGVWFRQSPIEIYNLKKEGKFRPLSSRPKGVQGFRPSCIISDECHEYSNRILFDSISSSAATMTRDQPVRLITTTAGFDEAGLVKEFVERGLEIQEGRVQSELFLPAIWKSKVYDERNAFQCSMYVNPSVKDGVVKEKVLKEQLEEAKLNEVKRDEFMAFHLNMPIRRGSKAWIPMDVWDECGTDEDIDWVFQKYPVYMGLDFGPQRDFTALAVVAFNHLDQKIYVKVHTWVTQREIRRQQAWKKPFNEWQSKGYFEPDLIETFDPSLLRSFLHRKVRNYKVIRQLGYDKSWIEAEMIRFDDEVPFNCVDIANTYYGINEAANFFLDSLLERKIVYKKNELLTYCAENTYVKVDPKQRVMLDKSNKDHKIDPIVAIVMAIDCMNRYRDSTPRSSLTISTGKKKESLFNKEK